MTRGKVRQLRALIEQLALTLDDETALNGVELFPMWKTATAYEIGDRVQYGGKLYKCNLAHTSQDNWSPDIPSALWSEVSADEWAEWKQPTGAHDAYNIGDKCSYNGKHYICTVDGNVYPPDVYGWELANG